MKTLDTQLFGITKSIKKGELSIADIGDILPASLMLQELEGGAADWL